MMRNFDEYMVREIFKEEGIELSDQEIRQLIAEGFMDKMKKWGRNAAMAGALAGAGMGLMGGQTGGADKTPQAQPQAQMQSPFQQEKFSQEELRNKFDMGELTPQQWTQYASQYGDPNGSGFVPNPKVPNQWIPGWGADSMRIQSQVGINNDELESDRIGLTPYKDGKAMGLTRWTDNATGKKWQSGYDKKGNWTHQTTTPFDGAAFLEK